MSMIQHAAPDPGATVPDGAPTADPGRGLLRALAFRAETARVAAFDGAWAVLHVLGAHRWTEGYDVDRERGMTRYRGSRCSICDNPWEGW